MANFPRNRIQITSDLHLEFYSMTAVSGEEEIELFNKIVTKNPEAKVLALLGDITLLTTEKCRAQYRRFIEWCIRFWDHVVIVTGNHEYYRKGTESKVDVATCDSFLFKLEEEYDHVYFLQKKALDLGDRVILGCTLWSHIPDEGDTKQIITKCLNDYKSIYIFDGTSLRLIQPDDMNRKHESHVAWLREQLELYKDREVIVLTHHTPSMQGTSDPCYDARNGETNHMAHAFSTDLTQMIADNPCIKIWGYGHTHFNNRQRYARQTLDHDDHLSVSSCLLISNQFGYMGENLENGTYDPGLTV